VLIKAENAQRSTPSCRASIPACGFFAAGGNACPITFLQHAESNLVATLCGAGERSQRTAISGSAGGGLETAVPGLRVSPRRGYRKLRFKFTARSSNSRYSACETSSAPN